MSEHTKVVKKTKDAVESKTLEIHRSPTSSFQTIYCNNTQVTVSYFDMKIMLGEVAAVTDESLEVTDKVAVYMSLEHAANLHRLLGEQLQMYVERFGPLREPVRPR